jgi:protein gp37
MQKTGAWIEACLKGRGCAGEVVLRIEKSDAISRVVFLFFFFKQWGGVNKKKSCRTLGGRTYDAMPLVML